MIKNPLLVLTVLSLATALPTEDLVTVPPGMIGAVIYSGYLNTATPGRQIHYVFVQANVTDPSTAPLAVWFNGGPGCSSLIGMIQEIGPFLVGNTYKLGDQLTKNQYSWAKVANLLFLQSPAIVGFSSDTDTHYHWTDQQAARDAFTSIKNFIFVKAPEFAERQLFISGESYAGKYIPDVADLILTNNADNKTNYINLKGIFVGNGVMNFQDNSLDKSSIKYMIDHNLISHRLEQVYETACQKNYKSPRCRFVLFELDILEAYLNPYNIYQTCLDRPTEAIRLKQALSHRKAKRQNGLIYMQEGSSLGEIPDCPSDNGAIQYWNLNKIAYKVEKVNKTWSVCSHLNYSISQKGSMDQYRRILGHGEDGAVRVWLFSGDWDDVVPYTDTQKNVDNLRRYKAGDWSSWNVGDQHAGFYQMYDKKLAVITVKGAGHMVPIGKPKASFQLFYNFINNKGVNNQIF